MNPHPVEATHNAGIGRSFDEHSVAGAQHSLINKIKRLQRARDNQNILFRTAHACSAM